MICKYNSEKSNSVFWVMLLWVKNRDSLMSYLKSNDIGASKLHHRNDDYSGFGVESRQKLENIKLDERLELIKKLVFDLKVSNFNLKNSKWIICINVCLLSFEVSASVL